MQITVKLYGTLRRYRPATGDRRHAPFALEIGSGATVSEALKQLGISSEIVSAVAVNGEQAGFDTILKVGDTIHLFPPTAGG